MSLIKAVIPLFFVFALMYTYFYAYSGGNIYTSSPVDTGVDTSGYTTNWISGLTGDTIDWILGFTSKINPIWALITYLIKEVSPYQLYFWLDMSLLRPTGWVLSILTLEWILNKFRGIS